MCSDVPLVCRVHTPREGALICPARRSDLQAPSGAFSPASASCRFLLELEHRMEENIVISDVCDIVYHYAADHFSVYITYVSNQTYQERTYKQLL